MPAVLARSHRGGHNDAMIDIREDDLTGAPTQTLIAMHLAQMHAGSPPGTACALDLSGLRAPGVRVWSAWAGAAIAGIAALRPLGDGAGELKSMRTHPDHLRRGVAAALLDRIVAEARGHGLTRLSLETGSGPDFDPALAFYRRHGFVAGAPFGAYRRNGFNQFLHLRL